MSTMTKSLKKMLISFLLVIIIFQALISGFGFGQVNAVISDEAMKQLNDQRNGGSSDSSTGSETETETKPKTPEQEKEDKDFENDSSGFLGGVVDGIVGFFLYIPKAAAVTVASLGRVLIKNICSISDPDNGEGLNGSIEDILFNRVEMTKLDFFNYDTGGTIRTIRENVAIWYTALRNLSTVILLLVLVYVGIRMATSTVASDEAKYKKMLKDWVVSFVLLFILHYIIILVLSVNNALVEIMSKAANNSENMGEAIDRLWLNSWDISFTKGVGNAIGYFMLIGMTIVFLFMYIKRMISVAFLIIIAPIITITYSIDKMGDGKSQALNTWLKEFVFSVLIQPFHCIIYLSLVQTGVEIMSTQQTLSSTILAIALYASVFTGEKVVKKVFHFEATSMSDALASAAVVTAGISTIKSLGSKGAKATGAVKNKVGSGGKGSKDKAPKMEAPNASNRSADRASEETSGGGANGEGGSGNEGGSNEGSGNDNSPIFKDAHDEQPKSSREKKAEKRRQGGSKILNTIGKVAKHSGKKVLKSYGKFAGKMVGTMLGAGVTLGATGSGKAAVAGGSALGGVASSLINSGSNYLEERQVKKNQRAFAGGYNQYANSETGSRLSESQMNKKTSDLLRYDSDEIGDIKNDDDRQYAQYLHDMKKTYEANGDSEDDAFKNTMNTVAAVQSGDIQETKRGEVYTRLTGEIPSNTSEPKNKRGRRTKAEKQQDKFSRHLEKKDAKVRDIANQTQQRLNGGKGK